MEILKKSQRNMNRFWINLKFYCLDRSINSGEKDSLNEYEWFNKILYNKRRVGGTRKRLSGNLFKHHLTNFYFDLTLPAN